MKIIRIIKVHFENKNVFENVNICVYSKINLDKVTEL